MRRRCAPFVYIIFFSHQLTVAPAFSFLFLLLSITAFCTITIFTLTGMPEMTSPRKHFLLGTGAALTAVAMWGSVPVFLGYLKDHISNAWTMNFYRYGFAGLLYVPVLIHYRRKKVLTRNIFKKSLFPSAVNICAQIIWPMLPYYMESGLIGVFIRSSVIWGILFSFIFFRDERQLIRAPLFWAGTMITIGAFLAMSFSTLDLTSVTGITGIILVIICSMFWGLYPVSVKYSMKGVPPLLSFGLICVNTASILVISGCFLGDPGEITVIGTVPAVILFVSALLGIALAHLVYYYAIEAIGVVRAGNINMIAPFYTVVLARLVLGEEITGAKLIFGSGIILGVLIVGMIKPVPRPARSSEESSR